MLQKCCLVVIDGWGISAEKSSEGDAIRNASTPVMDKLHVDYPNIPLSAHGLSVGLPDGLMGNSEVGHLNIGAGRIVYQDIVRIELAIKKDLLAKTKAVESSFEIAKKNGKIHFLGLVSDGGVHSHINHLKYLIKAAKEFGIKDCFVHFVADGRDTAPTSGCDYLKDLLKFMDELAYGKVATIVGRYYAMDRDRRWERIKIAYEAFVAGVGEASKDLFTDLKNKCNAGETDEFWKPVIVNDGKIESNDVVVCFNFRSDRMREITTALGIELPFETNFKVSNLHIVTMTSYKIDFPFANIFPPQSLDNVLAEWLGKHSISQNHIAETEKYAHVTFFFNGGTEKSFELEDRELIASPKVATYDLLPQMSAIEVGKKVAETVSQGTYKFVMCNFAPPDMVGHTGMYEPAIKGVEATDKAIGIIFEACQKAGYTLLVTADHGNAEQMINLTTGQPHTAHTCNQDANLKIRTDVEDPSLCDVAPTLLEVMGLPIPEEMTGRTLIQK